MSTDQKEVNECFRGSSLLCFEHEVCDQRVCLFVSFVLLVDICTHVTSQSNMQNTPSGKAGLLWYSEMVFFEVMLKYFSTACGNSQVLLKFYFA
jgi:hypothetical protein